MDKIDIKKAYFSQTKSSNYQKLKDKNGKWLRMLIWRNARRGSFVQWKKNLSGGTVWGYGGSGPQYMAEAIAMHYTNNNYTNEEWKRFLSEVIALKEVKGKDLFISQYDVSRYFTNSS